MAALGLVAACGSGGGHAKTTTVPALGTPTTVNLDTGAKELVALIAKGKAVTYHATYTAVVQSTTLSLELWQKPPLARRDASFTSGSSSTHTEEFKLNNELVGCIQQTGSSWKCTNSNSGQDPSDGVIGALTQALGNRTVMAKNDTVSGRAVRCYSAAQVGPLPPVQICLTPDTGIPVLVDAGAGKITLTGVDLTVPANVFSLPAAPTPAPTTTTTSTS